MDRIEAFVAPQLGDDEHVVLRLGWAVVRQWPNLPTSIRESIREQAGITELAEDRHMTVQLNEQIDDFLRKHTVAD